MGNYNPHAPYILGNEWVPIRQANWQPDDVTERGYEFSISHAVTPVTGAFYVSEVPESRTNQAIDLVSVYPAGQETLTGPVKVVNIPVSAVWTTGTAISNALLANVLNPSDGLYIRFDAPTDFFTWLGLSFDVAAYSQQLYGKRILSVKFRYSLSGGVDATDGIGIEYGFAKGAFGVQLNRFYLYEGLEVTNFGIPNVVNELELSSINPFWDSTRDPYQVHDVYPWRYQELARFMATEPAPTRMTIMMSNNLQGSSSAFLFFADMQVTYCEETRILYGATKTRSLQDSSGTSTQNAYELGPNLVRLRNSSALAYASTSLAPGSYVTTLVHAELPLDSNRGIPTLAGIRELYQLPQQQGLLIHQTLTPDAEFTESALDMLPEITLHTATAIITGTHPYGVQDKIPVYGSITATQEIEDDPVGTSKQYPQVRFYARHFGNTTIPLTLVDVATGTFTVSITVADFDALPEIVDGWREVTLRFTTPPSFATAAGDVDWRWQATGESAGNQWQVLGAGSRAFAAHSIGPASYYAPQGNTVTLTWQSPVISGTADDTLSDATLIFSADPPTVTGFAVSTAELELVSADPTCLVPNGCIPTAIQGNQLTWNALGVCDQFERTVIDGWGSADTGQAYSVSGGTAPGDYDVANGVGTHLLSTTAVARNSTVSVSAPLSLTKARVDVSVSALATGDSIIAGPAIGTDSDNMYQARLQFTTAGTVVLEITKRLGGAQASLGSATIGGYVANQSWTVEIWWAVGGLIRARAWPTEASEDIAAVQAAIDSGITTFTSIILRSVLNAGNTNVSPVVSFDNLYSATEQLRDGSIEVQRRDDVSEDWQTIMLSTLPGCVTSFSDYEGRVGQVSEYRIRTLNALDFYGPWVTGAGTIPAPGVTVGGSGNSVLIFTNNSSPDTSLAYVMQWEGQPIETFAFPEAGDVQLKQMFGKDFYTAFYPLERGGEQFTRTLLVNAAAIALPSMANFRTLRDLAWQELDYVCVRDELGNRWFANIRVPEGNVRMNRTIYLAQIQVTETTDTPSPVGEQ